MKRHLLLQEANNLLLQADITRREAELLHYKEYARKGTPIKRWNTFSGEENRQRVVYKFLLFQSRDLVKTCTSVFNMNKIVVGEH